ncbi:MAG: hypothetical protein Q7S82_02715 [bacterium]|nr:hypothetical protein [bacterium]
MKTIRGIFCVFILIGGLLSQACGEAQSPAPTSTIKSQQSTPQPQKLQTATSSTADQRDYFPIDIGREWTYDIKTWKVKPIIFDNVTILRGSSSYRKFFYAGSINPHAGVENYRLKMKIKGPFQEEQRLMSVELEVLEDSLGLFRYFTQVFWGLENFSLSGSQTGMLQAVRYSTDKFMADYPDLQLRSTDRINSEKVIFVWGGGGMIREDRDSIFFVGIDNNVPGYQGVPLSHFIRKVYSDKSAKVMVFSEDSWYAFKKGLVLLEQRIGGEISMVWQLSK